MATEAGEGSSSQSYSPTLEEEEEEGEESTDSVSCNTFCERQLNLYPLLHPLSLPPSSALLG